MGLSDPRTYGSGNPGATNVLRSGSKAAAILTLALDALKGWLPVALVVHFGPAHGLGEGRSPVVALAAFLGHLWPVFFRFKGGKGVATAAGALFGIDPLLGAATLATWLIIAAFFRYSSLASIVAAAVRAVLVPAHRRPRRDRDRRLRDGRAPGLAPQRQHQASLRRHREPARAEARRRLAAGHEKAPRRASLTRRACRGGSVAEAHRLAHVLHRLARDRARPLGADLDDPVHPLRVGQVRLGALAPRRLLAAGSPRSPAACSRGSRSPRWCSRARPRPWSRRSNRPGGTATPGTSRDCRDRCGAPAPGRSACAGSSSSPRPAPRASRSRCRSSCSSSRRRGRPASRFR